MKAISFFGVYLILLYSNCSSPKGDKSGQVSDSIKATEATSDSLKLDSWQGTWTFTDNGPIDYTLVIGELENEMYLCSYKAEGVQTSFELDCLGVSKDDSFKLYYQGVKEGTFLAADQINRDRESLTLKRIDGKVLTYWDQFFNNYVEEGNHSGTVCFQR